MTTPGGIEGVYASELKGIEGTWRSEAEMTQFEVRRTDSSTYLVSNESIGYEGEQMELFVFRFGDRVYVEQSQNGSDQERPIFYYALWEVGADTLRVIGGNAPFPESWSNESISPPGGPVFEVPVSPKNRAKALEAMFDYILRIWPENAPGRFERVK